MKVLPMNAPAPLTREEFENLLADHHELIRLANALEEQLYRLGESQTSEAVLACQRTAGTLVGRLRQVMFHHDQRVFPLLEVVSERPTGP
jgi:hemerythrin-like domain-containing protein